VRRPTLFGSKSADSRLKEGNPVEPDESKMEDPKMAAQLLPPAAAVDLINRMMQIATALKQAGVVKPGPAPSETSRSR
jgi:hypothetical protein